jgi:hypothetical protein
MLEKQKGYKYVFVNIIAEATGFVETILEP